MSFAAELCCAVLLDALLGDPRNFPHPVVLIGKVIDFLHKRLYTSPSSFLRGLVLCASTLLVTGCSVWLVLYVSGYSVVVRICLLYSALAWRDLKDETAPVLECLRKNDLTNARKYLACVVGRDTQNLTEGEISRAAIETIAENSVDGVMSVIFWAGVGQAVSADFGACVCVWVFKAVSTLDSMIGYEALGSYGKPSARLDDALNFIPARLGGIVIVFAGCLVGKNALNVFLSDRLRHKSPNSAHGEGAFAGVLGVRLGGGAFYGGVFEAREYINPNGRDPRPEDIASAWRVLDISCIVFTILVILAVCIIP
ncbi:MAG: cobalamin biosynthesis protein CobD [Synergistaceae bacterium]|nr:cobalamin biosynthesis protein CobD [Synergistaceae bacterium]